MPFGYTAALLASDGQLKGPDWYRQGVPLVFANTKYNGNRATLGTVQVDYALMLGQGSALIPMRTFLTLERASISGNALEKYDGEAWGLVHQVFVERWHRAEFVKYLGLLRQGSSGAEAFTASFKVTYEQLDKELAYALRQRAYAYTMNAPDPGSGGESARLLTADEVQARFDSLLALYAKSGSQ